MGGLDWRTAEYSRTTSTKLRVVLLHLDNGIGRTNDDGLDWNEFG